MKAIRAAFVGFWSLIVGLGVTIRHFLRTTVLRKKVTEQYPHEKPVMSKAYRSAIKLIRFSETNSHDCVGCKACERICPSFCISVDGDKVEGIRKKRATHFQMDFALCSLCGLCIDACPTDTLEYSKLYDEVGYTRHWKHDLLADFQSYEEQFVAEQRVREEAEAAEKARAAEEKKRAAEAAKAAKASAAPNAGDAAAATSAGADPAADAAAAEKKQKIEAAMAAKAARLAAKAAGATTGDGNSAAAGDDAGKPAAAAGTAALTPPTPEER